MNFNFEPRKLIPGIVDNQTPMEGPNQAPNGTAVVVKFNEFIDALQLDLNTKLPHLPGQILVGTSNGFEKLNATNNREVLTIDLNEPTGLKWAERVDLTSNQAISGVKIFNNSINFNSDIEVLGNSYFRDNVICEENLRAKSLYIDSTLEVINSTILKGTLLVQGAVTLTGPVNITQPVTISNSLVSSVDIRGLQGIFGSANISNLLYTNNLQVEDTANIENLNISNVLHGVNASLSGTLSVGNSAVINGTLQINDNTNITENLTVSKNISGDNLNLSNDLNVIGSVSIGDTVNLESDLSVQGTLNILGGANLGNIVSTTLEVSGISNLGGINSTGSIIALGSLTIQGDSTVRNLHVNDLSITGEASFAGQLTVTGPTNINNGLSAQEIFITNGATIGSSINCLQNIYVQGLGVFNNLITQDTGTVLRDATINDLLVSNNANIPNLESQNIETTAITVHNNITCSSYITGNIITANSITLNNNSVVSNLATANAKGYVLTDLNSSNPIVYLKESVDNNFINRQDLYEYTISNSSLPSSKIVVVNHNLSSTKLTAVTIWGDESIYYAPVSKVDSDAIRIDLSSYTGVNTWNIKILK